MMRDCRSPRLWASLSLVVVLCTASMADVFYVDDDAAAGGDGVAWTRAFRHLADALSVAGAGDEIRVAQGLYRPGFTDTDPNVIPDREASFLLPQGVGVYGGFAGLGQGDPNYCQPDLFPTVLTGDLLGNDQPGFAGYEDNCRHVITAVGVDAQTVLDGFVITGGNCQGQETNPDSLGVRGGGMLNDNADPTIRRCRFVRNTGWYDGAMLNINGSDPVVIGCRFLSNQVTGSAAAVRNRNNSRPTFINCVFSGNHAGERGGAVYDDFNSAIHLVNCTLVGNSAGDRGGAIHADQEGRPSLTNCVVWGNTDSTGHSEAAQIAVAGGAAVVNYSCVEGWTGVLGGLGNRGDDPLLMNPAGLDGLSGTEDDDLRLSGDSPCIDAGVNSVVTVGHDLAGSARIVGMAVDMGAYEYKGPVGLVAHWTLDERSGLRAYDELGRADGVLVGNRRWRPYEGRVGGALDFDGLGDFVDCGAGSIFDLRDAVTVTAWFQVRRFDRSYQAIVTKGDSAFRLQRYSNTSVLEFACSGVDVPGTTWSNIWGTTPVDDGQWHHAAGVYDGQRMYLYVDGELDASSEATGRLNLNDYPVWIGENAERQRRYWNGLLDDVRIYNHALSPTEIRRLAQPGRTWHVDGTHGSIQNDGLRPDSPLLTIQSAIDRAAHGDRVLVWPGVYREEVDFRGLAITVTSAAEPAVIEAPNGWAVSFVRAEGPASVLSHFIIRNSRYAVFVWMGRPTLRNLTVVRCEFGVDARAGATPEITNCIFWGNLYTDLAHDDLSDCVVRSSWLQDWIEPEPVAWWAFREGYGALAYDWYGGHHGTIQGAQWTTGVADTALEFDGIDDFVHVANAATLQLGRGDYSMCLWVRPQRVHGYQALLAKVEGDQNKEYMLGIENAELRLDVENQGNDGRERSPMSIEPGRWQHVAVTFDADRLEAAFYLDGERQLSGHWDQPGITALPTVLTNDLVFGMRDGLYRDSHYAGALDEVMLFDRVLTDEQVTAVYRRGLGPLFADPDRGDYHLKSEFGRHWVPDGNDVPPGGLWVLDDQTSPCVDAGDWQEGPGLEPEPNGGRVNMGAYGGTPFASRGRWPLRGDIDRDGRVGLPDLAILAEDWMLALPWAR